MSFGEAYFRQAAQTPGRHRQQPTRAIHYQPQVQARMVLEALGFSGPITIISNACASGSNAVGHACELVRSGQAEGVLAGGYDALSQMVFSGFDALQALSPTICRPFDARRDGLALGEGAAVIALESLERARARDATILGELIGYGTSIDQHHLTQPHPQGETALAVMKLACESAGVTPEDVDYVNAHGTGRRSTTVPKPWPSPIGRAGEPPACRQFHQSQHRAPPGGRRRSRGGDLPDGAERTMASATGGVSNPDPACNFPIVHEARDARVNVALSNSLVSAGSMRL